MNRLRLGIIIVATAVGISHAGEPYGRVRTVEGSVSIFHPSSSSRHTPTLNFPVPAESRIRTSQGERLEVDFGPATTLWVAESSELEIRETASDRRLEFHLRKGRAALETRGALDAPLQLSTEFGMLAPQTACMMFLAKVLDTAVLDVRSGVVEATGRGYATLASADSRLVIRHGAALRAAPINPAAPGRLRDAFVAWVEDRRATRPALGDTPGGWEGYRPELAASGRFIPCSVAPECFVPATPDPAPLESGRYVSLGDQRVWIADAVWGWVTSHYGGWTRTDEGWVWIPGPGFKPGPARWAAGEPRAQDSAGPN